MRQTCPGRGLRCATHIVQVHQEDKGVERLSIHRTALNNSGDWCDGITWDDLYELKWQCGRGNRAAVEIYPPEQDIVAVANLRHLWVLPEPPPFMWRR